MPDSEEGGDAPELSLKSYGTRRSDAPQGAPEFEHLLAAFRRFVEDMRAAEFVFENEDDVEGCMIALHAAIRLLAVRHLPTWRVLAEIHEAFKDLRRGVDPELFSRSAEQRPRSRSGRRKHAQLLAAVCLGWLMDKGDPLDQAARAVARRVNKWAEFSGTDVSHETIRHWRDAALSDQREQYDRILSELKKDPQARKRIEELLGSGPPASAHPRNRS
jgi:hypothetical protein